MEQLTVSISPHIYGVRNTRSVMLDVILALLPAGVASVILFGLPALWILIASVASCVLFEFLFNKIARRPNTVGDFSAIVTGVLLALNCPSSTPIWQVVIGAFIAIVIAKCLFGGLGQNFANPAIVARVAMLLSFSSAMTKWNAPVVVTDATSSATPLSILNGAEGTLPSLKEMLLGIHAGSMGETCIIALVVGGIYLMIRKVISWRTPVAFIGTVFVFSWIVTGDVNYALYAILAGGLFIGAIFMATDYATTPITDWGKVIFGIGCGLLTSLIRIYGNYPEGVSFAILFMNILTPYIERWTAKKPFGGVKA